MICLEKEKADHSDSVENNNEVGKKSDRVKWQERGQMLTELWLKTFGWLRFDEEKYRMYCSL